MADTGEAHGMDERRRRLLHLGAIAASGGLAGCSSPTRNVPAGDEEATATPPSTSTPSAGSTPAVEGPPGADVLGGPDRLSASATVDATVLSEDAGAGRNVNTPAVVWVEPGATVTWNVEGGTHSVTAYHPDNDRPLRIPEGAEPFDSGVLSAGETFEHTFETEGVFDYFCIPHESLGMVGLVIVGGPRGGPGTTAPEDVSSGGARSKLTRLLEAAGIAAGGGDGGTDAAYGWQDATWDAYWYSLYNMSTNIAMSGNGVLFPHNEEQRAAFERRFPAMLEAANQEQPPVANPNLNMAPFTAGDPQFTQQPVLSGPDGRPDASTLRWDRSASSEVVSPSSLAWTHLKGITWAKNFQNHFDVLPDSLAAEFRSQVLATLAQIGINAGLVAGGPQGNGALTKGETMELVSTFRPGDGSVPDDAARPHHHSATLWFLSDAVSLATGGWFGYENPEPLIPPAKVQQLTDGIAQATMSRFPPDGIGSTRDVGEMLGAVGWYGTHAGSDDRRAAAAEYANGLAARIEGAVEGNGRVAGGAANQAATQGVVGQGLLWASRVEGVDHAGLAGDVLGYMLDALWDEAAGTFASGEGDETYAITARDAGDVTGGLNAADALLGVDGVKETFARYFDATVNRGRLQRAERPPSRDPDAQHTLPLPPKAGGEFGQAAVYNAAVEYDTGAGEWRVTDPRFHTASALYLANQDIWISQWGGDFFDGRGVPGENDEPA